MEPRSAGDLRRSLSDGCKPAHSTPPNDRYLNNRGVLI
jgi:hypothetical protein